MRKKLRQEETRATEDGRVGAACCRCNCATIQPTAAPSSAEGVAASKLFSMESSVWQCAQLSRCAAAFASTEAFSASFSRVSSGRQSLPAEAASCHIFKAVLLSAMVLTSVLTLSLSNVLQPGPIYVWR